MKLGMIGTGYVGLVSGVCFSDLGNDVICVDKDLRKIENLKNGIIPIYEPGLDELVIKNYKNKRLKFSTNLKDSILKSDIIFICVGTPTKKNGNNADLSQVYNVAKEISKFIKKFRTSVMASMKVNKNDVSRWGIYKIKKKIDKNNFIINNVVEKPSINLSPSNNAVIGRYILPKTIFSKLKSLKPGKGGESHITDAIQNLIEDDHQFIGHNFSGKYLDCGTMKGYIKSTLEISKQ